MSKDEKIKGFYFKTQSFQHCGTVLYFTEINYFLFFKQAQLFYKLY